MRRPLLALLLLLAAVPSAQAAVGGFFPGEVVDATGVVGLQDLDVARDGHGVVAYLRADGLHVGRFVDGALLPPERADGGVPGVRQAAVAVSDGGRIAVAFVAAGGVFASVRPAGAPGFLPAQQLAGSGSDPSIDLSTGGHAYAVFRSDGDLRAARMDRREDRFAVLTEALDLDPAADPGANGRPRVATSADGTAIAVWGEGGRVIARRLFGLSVSRAPQVLADEGSDPDVDIEDDSSFAWATYRTPGGVLARRQRGSAFDDPVPAGAAEDPPRVDLAGRGEAFVTAGAGGTATAAQIKEDRLLPPSPLGPAAGGGLAVPAVADGGDATVAWLGPDGSVRARHFDNDATVRTPAAAGPEAVVSDPALGTVDASLGLDAASDRGGDALIAFTQVDAVGLRRIALARFDRAPGSFWAYTSESWRSTRHPPLRWSPSFELWGPLRYRVEIDGVVIGESTVPGFAPRTAISDGEHPWSVVAIDRRGQETRMRPRTLRIDGTRPKIRLRRRGRRIEIRAADGPARRSSGLERVTVDLGSRANRVTIRKAPFRLRRRYRGTVRVTAIDRAGNIARRSR